MDPSSREMRPGIEPPFEFIADRLRKGRVIPFVGAGASMVGRQPAQIWNGPHCNFLPLAGELATYLDGRSGFPSTPSAELTRVAQYFDGVTGRGGLDEELHDVFSKDYRPSALHYWLAGFDNILIVTTNYDHLLERAFRERERPYNVVSYRTGASTFLYRQHGASAPTEVAANELTLDMNGAPTIYKMHGSADTSVPERDSYVITEDDYVEFLARMVGLTAIPAAFAEPFRKSHFLFLGYGLRDWNLRVILHKMWHDWPRRYASWAIQHRAEPLEAEFWKRRQLTIYELEIDEFLRKIGARPDHEPA